MRYFLDTEFNEDGKTIDLISLGIYGDNRGLYLISSEFNEDACQPWVKENVLPKLGVPFQSNGDTLIQYKERMSRVTMRNIIEDFIGNDKPQFWAYLAPTDWVAFYQLWGRLLDLPDNIPMMCWDLKQLAKTVGSKHKMRDFITGDNHNAFDDAKAAAKLFDAIAAESDPNLIERIKQCEEDNTLLPPRFRV